MCTDTALRSTGMRVASHFARFLLLSCRAIISRPSANGCMWLCGEQHRLLPLRKALLPYPWRAVASLEVHALVRRACITHRVSFPCGIGQFQNFLIFFGDFKDSGDDERGVGAHCVYLSRSRIHRVCAASFSLCATLDCRTLRKVNFFLNAFFHALGKL